MTYTKRVARLLMERPCTLEEICQSLGLTAAQARATIGELSRKERVSRAPVTYQITEIGATFAQREPAAAEHAKKMRALRAAKRRERERLQEIKSAQTAASLIAQAQQSRSPLESAWMGGLHG